MTLLEEQYALARICGRMSATGIPLDLARLNEVREQMDNDKLALTKDFIINIRSPKQIKGFFYEKGIHLPNTSKVTLERFARAHPDVPELGAIVEYKGFGKGMKAWYDDKYIQAAHLHPRWNPIGTVERRLACSAPNFQNVPARNAYFAALMRSVVIPEPGYTLYEIDASSGEDWSCAFAAKDDRLLSDLATGVDFHSRTASYIFDRPITKKDNYYERDIGKRCNHMHKYGQGFKFVPKRSSQVRKYRALEEDGLALFGWEGSDYLAYFNGWRMSEIAYGEATRDNQRRILKVKAKLVEDYRGIAQWQQDTFETWRKTNYVRNPFGFGRPLYGDEEECLKRGLAFLGASTLQTVVIRGMIDLDKEVLWPVHHVLLHAQIHDSLMSSLREPDYWGPIIQEIMERPRRAVDGRELKIPWKGSTGERWSDL